MEKNDINKSLTEDKNKQEFNIIVTYAKNGLSFQEIAEKILIRKLNEI